MGHQAKVSPIIFVAGILCFLLPFLTVSCGGQRVGSFTGVQLAIGTTVEQPQMFGPPLKQKVNLEPLAGLALLCALTGLGLSFIGPRVAIAPAVSGAVGGISLLLLKSRMDDQILKQGHGMLQVNYETGFSLALLLLIAGAAWNAYAFSQRISMPLSDLPNTKDPPGSRGRPGMATPVQPDETDRAPLIARPPVGNVGSTEQISLHASIGPVLCSHCGAAFRSNAKFCTNCGKPAVQNTVSSAPNSASQVESTSLRPLRVAASTSAEFVGLPPSLPARTNLAFAPESEPVAEMSHPPVQSMPELVPVSSPVQLAEPLPKAKLKGLVVASVMLAVLAVAGATWYLWGVEIIVVSSPPGARVFLDNQEISPQSFGRFVVPHVARRQHTLKIQREGYEDSVQNLGFPVTAFTEWVTVTLTPKISKPLENSSPQAVQASIQQSAVPDAVSAPEQTVPPLAGVDCSDESVVRSTQSSTGTTVQFLNRTAGRINIYWLDFTGQRRLYSALSPGESYVQSTFATHSWLAADPQGNCIVIFRADVNPGQAVVQPSAD